MKQLNLVTSGRARFFVGIALLSVSVVGLMWSLRPKPASAPQAAAVPIQPAQAILAHTLPPAPAQVAPAADWTLIRRIAQRRKAEQAAAALNATNQPPAPSIEELYGIQVRGVRVSLGESFLDLRYRVLDAEKASRLATGMASTYLLDSTSGAMLLMKKPPGEGAFPPTGNRLVKGRTYFALVANPDKMVKSGSQVVFHVEGAEPTKLVVQ